MKSNKIELLSNTYRFFAAQQENYKHLRESSTLKALNGFSSLLSFFWLNSSLLFELNEWNLDIKNNFFKITIKYFLKDFAAFVRSKYYKHLERAKSFKCCLNRNPERVIVDV